MKRTARIAYLLPLGLCLCAGLSAGLGGCQASGGTPRIGVALFSVDDEFISYARRSLEASAEGKARLSILDGRNDQRIQNEQIDAMIADKAQAIIVNPVDVSAMSALVFRAKAGGVPIVFFSRDPEAVTVQSWDKAFFVGVRSAEADALQVDILAEYWKSSQAADKNGDGRLQYVLVRGDANHAAALESADTRQAAFKAAGIVPVKLSEVVADRTRVDAQRKLAALLPSIGVKSVEAVICANDEMALGAIEALRMAGVLKNAADYVPVVGADGTRSALEAIGEGRLLGTVRGDASRQGKMAFDIAYVLATGRTPLEASIPLTDGKLALVPYVKVTSANYRAFMN